MKREITITFNSILQQVKGKKGELRSVIGITKSSRVEPLECFANTEWEQIETIVRNRIQIGESSNLTFVLMASSVSKSRDLSLRSG